MSRVVNQKRKGEFGDIDIGGRSQMFSTFG